MIDSLNEQNKRIAAFISLLLGKCPKKNRPLGNRISFIKGKPAVSGAGKPLPYLNMDYLSGGDPQYSCEGLLAQNDDVLMLMDGASSGAVYIGQNGYVGSTFAIIEHSDDINPFVLYCVLKENEGMLKTRTTGSAIPHTDKALVASLGYPLISNEDTCTIESLLRRKQRNQEEIRILKSTKSVLLHKHFSTNR